MKKYYLTTKIKNISKQYNLESELEEIDNQTNRLETYKRLKNIYCYNNNDEYDNLDYENLYNIFYLLCNSNYEQVNYNYKVKYANNIIEHIKQLKSVEEKFNFLFNEINKLN